MSDTVPLPEPDLAELRSLRAEVEALRRYKSTTAPRVEALQGLLEHAQRKADAGAEAVATLWSERAANAMLTAEVEALKERLAHAGIERQRAVTDEPPEGRC